MVLVLGKPGWKRPFGEPRHRWENNNRLYVKETECEGMNLSRLTKDSVQWWVLVNAVMNRRVS